jgi:hypothetical protein
VYSLFSVDAFTTRVQQIIGRDPPTGLSTGLRALLLALMAVNLVVAVAAEAASGLAIRGVEALRDALEARRRGAPGGARDAAARQALLMAGGLPAVRTASGAPGASPSPTGAVASGAGEGVAAVHVPRMARPAGAELL